MDTITKDTSTSNNSDLKIPRFRSVAYPSSTLSYCIGLVERIYKAFGNVTYVPRERISKQLDIGDGTLQTQLSSCVQYGLLELKPKEGYKATINFITIYRPKSPEEKREVEIQCFKTPDLYRNVIKNYKKGDVLTIGGLSTVLYRDFKVSENASTTAAKVFIENASYVSLLTPDNKLDLEGDLIQVEDFGIPEEVDQPQQSQKPEISYLPPPTTQPAIPDTTKFSVPPIPIFLEEGVAELYLPNGFKKIDIERVIKILKAYVE